MDLETAVTFLVLSSVNNDIFLFIYLLQVWAVKPDT